MSSLPRQHHLSRFTVKRVIEMAILLAMIFFLASCGKEKTRTEAGYIDKATEAHAAGDSDLALLELASGIRNYPKNADLYLLRGKIFLDLEDGSSAEISFNKAIALGYNEGLIKHEIAESWLYQRDPGKVIENLEPEILKGSKDPLLYEVVGRAYIALADRTNVKVFIKNMTMARKYINQAYKLNPNSTRVLITKAWLSAMTGKLNEALGWLDKANAIVKDQRENLAVKGELLVRQNKIKLAQKVYARLIKKFPQYPQYKLELGYSYSLSHDYTTARKWIEAIAKKYPDNLRATYLLADISLMEKNYQQAKQLSDAVLAKSPNDLKAIIINGASSYFLGDFENAHQKLSYFYNRTRSIPALKLLVATKLKLHEDKDAAKLLKDAGQTVEKQTDSDLLNLVAIAFVKIGKVDIALKAYKKLAVKQPDVADYKSNIGLIQISQGNFDEGFKNLEKSLQEKNPEKKNGPESKIVANKNLGENLYILASKALQTRQYVRAASYIDQYKKIAANSYKPWIMSAVLHTILKKPVFARQDFNKAMKIAPDVAEVRARYAIFENMQGNHDKALELARQGLKLDPGDIGSAKLILGPLVKQKKFKDVRKIIDKAIGHANISAISKLLFADYYTLLGTPQKTLNILDGLPNSLKATTSYKIIAGKAYLRSGQALRAVPLLEDFSQKNPKDIPALQYLLRGYWLTGNRKNYQSILERIDKLDPDNFNTRIELAKLSASLKKYDRAENILNALKGDNNQQNLQKEIILAMIKTNRKDFTAALAILSPLNKKYPENGVISMIYARNLVDINQMDKALTVTKAWASQHPDNLEVKQSLGDLYLHTGDNNNARRQYDKILASKTKIPARIEFHAHNNLAMIYLADNHLQKAMNHARKALDLAPNNPAIIDTFAQVLMKQGQTGQAIKHYNQALALLPNNDGKNRAKFSFSKAKALIQDGQKDEAKKILTLLIRDEPAFSQIDEVRKILSGL